MADVWRAAARANARRDTWPWLSTREHLSSSDARGRANRFRDAARWGDDATARLCERRDTAGDRREADFERGWSEFARGSHSAGLPARWSRELTVCGLSAM